MAPGALVGRLRSADLQLADPRVSEAHALLSLRGLELRLLALRGRFAVDGRVQDEVALSPGMTVEFAPGLAVDVVEVVVPDAVLALEGPGLPAQVLSGVCSLVIGPPARLVERYQGDADAVFHWDGSTWWARAGNGAARPVADGDSVEVRGLVFTTRSVPVAGLPDERTRDGGLRPALRIEARFDSVTILRDGQDTVVLSGLSARIVSELVAMAGPVSWQVLAGQLWPEDNDAAVLRSRFDVALLRLRRKLREARLPPDLVRADRLGFLELVVQSGDEILDRM
jgi:hypothetical protein